MSSNSKQANILTCGEAALRRPEMLEGVNHLWMLFHRSPGAEQITFVNKHFIIHQRCFLFLMNFFYSACVLWGTNIDEADFAVADLMSFGSGSEAYGLCKSKRDEWSTSKMEG